MYFVKLNCCVNSFMQSVRLCPCSQWKVNSVHSIIKSWNWPKFYVILFALMQHLYQFIKLFCMICNRLCFENTQSWRLPNVIFIIVAVVIVKIFVIYTKFSIVIQCWNLYFLQILHLVLIAYKVNEVYNL